jgi:putative redox protein
MESVLISVGACSSVDVVEIMRKSRQQMQGCYCELEAERAESAPRKFIKIHAHFVVQGKDINEKHLARAVQLSTEKYCSVMLMLTGNVNITTSFAIQDR